MSYEIRLERHLHVTPDVAFHHWVDAEQRRVWYRGDEDDWIVEAATDLRVGGRFIVRWGPAPDDAYQEDGTFEVVDPPHRLVYTSRFTPRTPDEGDPFELRITITFEPEPDGTMLRIVETGYPTAEIRDAFQREGTAQGLAFYERTLPTAP